MSAPDRIENERDEEKKTRARAIIVVPRLPPGSRTTELAERFPSDIYESKIVSIGTPASYTDLEGGGLIIDYIPSGCTRLRRLVLAFNDLGMWIESLTDMEA
jgi:hypothetical protein